MLRSLLPACLLAAIGLGVATAEAARYRAPALDEYAENRINPLDGDIPGCADPAVLGKITHRFASREATYWGPIRIVAIDHIRPLAFRPWGPEFIPRRFCSARVITNDGVKRRVDYSVREDLGLFARGWDVNWCVTGLDRHRSYAPDCKMARP